MSRFLRFNDAEVAKNYNVPYLLDYTAAVQTEGLFI